MMLFEVTPQRGHPRQPESTDVRNLRFFRRGAWARQLAVLLIALLSVYLFFSPVPRSAITDLPYPLYLFTTAEPSTLLLLSLVILLIVLVGRGEGRGTKDSPRLREDSRALTDRSEKVQ